VLRPEEIKPDGFQKIENMALFAADVDKLLTYKIRNLFKKNQKHFKES